MHDSAIVDATQRGVHFGEEGAIEASALAPAERSPLDVFEDECVAVEASEESRNALDPFEPAIRAGFAADENRTEYVSHDETALEEILHHDETA